MYLLWSRVVNLYKFLGTSLSLWTFLRVFPQGGSAVWPCRSQPNVAYFLCIVCDSAVWHADWRWRVQSCTEKYQPVQEKCAWIYTGNHIFVSTPLFNNYWVIEYLILTKLRKLLLYQELSTNIIIDNLNKKLQFSYIVYVIYDIWRVFWFKSLHQVFGKIQAFFSVHAV
jgi:hypothetical protein